MKKQNWNSIEEFLSQNQTEFIHVDSEEEFQYEVDKINHENNSVISIITGANPTAFRCKKWRPVQRQICRFINGTYECVTHTRYECVER